MNSTALLVMDFQVGVAAACPTAPGAAERAAIAIERANDAKIPVLYGRVGLRAAGGVSMRNGLFSAVADSGAFAPAAATGEFLPEVAPPATAIVFEKCRMGAFSGSDLDILLRSLDINTIALAGLYTSGVVLSTLRVAADFDFRTVVLSDACADPDPEVHDVLMSKVFPMQAVVDSVDSWATSLATVGHV